MGALKKDGSPNKSQMEDLYRYNNVQVTFSEKPDFQKSFARIKNEGHLESKPTRS